MASTNISSTPATLSYFVPPENGVRAYQRINADPITGEREHNFTRSKHDAVIENVRGKEDQYTIDNSGFQFVRSPAKHTSFNNDDEIEKEYYPESIDLLKKLTGASRVVIFDHTIRRQRPGEIDDTPQKRQPVSQVHVDQTTKASIARVHRHLPAEDAPRLLEKRFQIINLWRPINVPALRWPLALCDYRSVDPSKDPLPVALYLRGMTPEEAVLIKCFDSVQDGSVAVFTPHTGFEDPTTPPDAPNRESIELRALVFYD
ncbi:hypothetical protein EST38_g3574 [Candolleomyces aberdarensis]|uniref:Methyltransferase n=1 Tax=Candolleomyces aberdarensis TaxID=2316362 RepID=A0A4Q2DQ12_9AGAR|nr:hypothetical protein EST38_g3574 [Candolleomyces aberdarensis]